MKKLSLKVISILTSIFVLIIVIPISNNNQAKAADKYITIEAFAKELVPALELLSIEGPADSGYINALLSVDIIKEGDVSSYTKYLTRTDALVFLNRADEFLNGNKLENDLVQMAIEKRISDINQIKESKREDVAKAYLKGFMKGYSNGKYAPNRQIKGSSKITKDGALNCIKMVKDKSLRAKISPDGQLIRMNDLPKDAKMYPYILESFPNEYYENPFFYDNIIAYDYDGNVVKLKHLEEYAAPSEIDKSINYIKDFPSVRKKYLDDWVDKVEKHLNLIFNVNYKIIDTKWVEEVVTTTSYYNVFVLDEKIREQVNEYVCDMKKNKSIIESEVIAVDGSSLYFYDGAYFLRAYVKYRIVSSLAPSAITVDEFIDTHPYNDIVFSNFSVDLRGYKVGRWEEDLFEIKLSEPLDTNGRDLGVMNTYIRRVEK